VKKLDDHISDLSAKYNDKFDQNTSLILCYTYYVRWKMGHEKNPRKDIEDLLSRYPKEAFGLNGLAMLLTVLSEGNTEPSLHVGELLRYLSAKAFVEIDENTGTVKVDNPAADLYYPSDYRLLGLLLEAFVNADPENKLIPMMVKTLLTSQRQGIWDNTQGNLWAFVGLYRYFRVFEKYPPKFTCYTWFESSFVREQDFTKQSLHQTEVKFDIKVFKESKKEEQDINVQEQDIVRDVLFHKDGQGRLYYRLALFYSPKVESIEPIHRGFSVFRKYTIFNEAIKSDLLNEFGRCEIKQGTLVVVKLTMTSQFPSSNIALVDKLPAGFEFDRKKNSEIENKPWFNHVNYRDERVEIFAAKTVPEDLYEFSYVVRATTVGQFTAPPVKCEEMYTPDIFGTSRSNFVIITEKEK